jgi:hypothetical protein
MKIDDFKAKLSGGGARPNLFKVTLNFPGVAGFVNNEEASFLIKAASLPGSNLGRIEVPFRGRTLKVAGDRTFDAWTITVINDTNFRLRNAFERWSNAISANKEVKGSVDLNYMADARVEQLDRDGKTVKTYTFRDMWPAVVSAIDLSFDTRDTIEEFTVEFDYQYWE